MFERLRNAGFDVMALHHAEAIISQDMPAAEADIESVLLDLDIPVVEIVAGGAAAKRQAHNAFVERSLAWAGISKLSRSLSRFDGERRVTKKSSRRSRTKSIT